MRWVLASFGWYYALCRTYLFCFQSVLRRCFFAFWYFFEVRYGHLACSEYIFIYLCISILSIPFVSAASSPLPPCNTFVSSLLCVAFVSFSSLWIVALGLEFSSVPIAIHCARSFVCFRSLFTLVIVVSLLSLAIFRCLCQVFLD